MHVSHINNEWVFFVFSRPLTMCIFFVIAILFFIPTFSCANLFDSSKSECFPTYQWHEFVTNDLQDVLNVTRIYVTDESHHPPYFDYAANPGETMDWHFCRPYIGKSKVRKGEFIWGSKNINVDLFNKQISKICYKYKPILATQHCYWSIRPDAFYVSRKNSPFPGPDWHNVYPWPQSIL